MKKYFYVKKQIIVDEVNIDKGSYEIVADFQIKEGFINYNKKIYSGDMIKINLSDNLHWWIPYTKEVGVIIGEAERQLEFIF